MTPFENVLALLPEAKRISKFECIALCRAHDDRNPSLSIREREDGSVSLKCYAGCEFVSVLASLGLRTRNLYPGGSSQASAGRAPAPFFQPATKLGAGPPLRAKKPKRIFTTADFAIAFLQRGLNHDGGGPWTVTRKHFYVDRSDAQVLCVVRLDSPVSNRKEYRPIGQSGGSWYIGDPPGELPLYRLPRLAAAEHVIVVEGEKCADAACSLGLVATTSAHGAKSPHKSDWQPLAGGLVTILPDNDDPGWDYAMNVARILMALSPPARVKLVGLPELGESEDIADLIAVRQEQGIGGIEIRREIEALIEEIRFLVAADFETNPVVPPPGPSFIPSDVPGSIR